MSSLEKSDALRNHVYCCYLFLDFPICTALVRYTLKDKTEGHAAIFPIPGGGVSRALWPHVINALFVC